MEHEVALSFWERLRGVIGKGPNFKPLFIPKCKSIHTFWMSQAIDIFWLDEVGKVIKIDRSVLPRKIRSCGEAYGVLETPQKKIKKIKIGEKIINFSPKGSFLYNGEKGSVITEFALILPVLVLLIFGFLQLSLVLVDKLKQTHATNYATFVAATTNDNTKLVAALAEYYTLSEIDYTLTSISAVSGMTIADSSRRHNDIIKLEVKKSFPIQIPLMTITNIDITTKSTARVLCTKKTAPYVCD